MLQIVGYRQRDWVHCVPCAEFDFSYPQDDASAFTGKGHAWSGHVMRKEKAHPITSTDEGWEIQRCDQCLCRLSDPVMTMGGPGLG